MTTLLLVLLSIETLVLLVGGFLFYRYVQRLFNYDELFQYLQEDIDVNIQNFDKLRNTPMLSNAPEIVNAAKLMSTMRDRLHEYVTRIEENSLHSKDSTTEI